MPDTPLNQRRFPSRPGARKRAAVEAGKLKRSRRAGLEGFNKRAWETRCMIKTRGRMSA